MFTPEQKFVVTPVEGSGKFATTRFSLREVLPTGKTRLATRKSFSEVDFAVNFAMNFGAEYGNIDTP